MVLPAQVMMLRDQGHWRATLKLKCFVELWSLGRLSSTVLQHIGFVASLAAPRPQVEAFAEIGTYGTHNGNAHRGLSAKLNLGNYDIAKPLAVDLQVVDSRARPPKQIDLN